MDVNKKYFKEVFDAAQGFIMFRLLIKVIPDKKIPQIDDDDLIKHFLYKINKIDKKYGVKTIKLTPFFVEYQMIGEKSPPCDKPPCEK